MKANVSDADGLEDLKINTKLKLSALWASLMFLYIYADVLSLFRPGQIDEIRRGLMGPVEVSQASLLAAAIIVIIPALMVALSLILKAKANRQINIILGSLFTLVSISNLLGEGWAYYLLFGILEIGITVLIVVSAWKWPKI